MNLLCSRLEVRNVQGESELVTLKERESYDSVLNNWLVVAAHIGFYPAPTVGLG